MTLNSNDAIGEVQAAMLAQLEANAPLMAIIKGVTDGASPEQDIPYVSFGQKIATMWNTLTKQGWNIVITLDIWASLTSGDTATTILAMVNSILHKQTLTLVHFQCVPRSCVNEWATVVEEQENDIRHIPTRFRVLVQQN